MIANISPSSLTYEDTYNTLKYASRAKNIKTTLQKNVLGSNMPKEFLLKKYNSQMTELEKLKSENEKLKERNKMLESELVDQQILLAKKSSPPAANKTTGPGGDCNEDLTQLQSRIDEFYSNFKKVYEKCLSLQSSEKFLKFKIDCKEKLEGIRKILTLDGTRLDIVSFTISLFF
jgi:kinesin family member 18/19